MSYDAFLMLLQSYAEEDFTSFQRKLIPTQQHVLGVRTSMLRKIAKTHLQDFERIFSYPDTVYEVTFIKLAQVSLLPFEKFVLYVKSCVDKMDNWSTCDLFKANCIRQNKDDFLPVLEEIFAFGEEFAQRYVLVMLLYFYVDKRYLDVIANYIVRADTTKFYVSMAVAWLVAELLVEHFNFGKAILERDVLDTKTRNKAIQKAIESYRINQENKEILRKLRKIK